MIVSILLLSAFLGFVVAGLFGNSNNYWSGYAGAVAGLLVGLTVIVTIEYADTVARRKTTSALISLMTVAALSATIPLAHADYYGLDR